MQKYTVNATVIIGGRTYYPGEIAELEGDFTVQEQSNQLIPLKSHNGEKTGGTKGTSEAVEKVSAVKNEAVKPKLTGFTAADILKASERLK